MKSTHSIKVKASEAEIQLTLLHPRSDAGDSDSKVESPSHTYQPGLVAALARTFGTSFLPAIVLKILFDILTFVNPLLLK